MVARRRLWPLAVLALIVGDARAVPAVQLSVAAVAAAGWRAEEVRVTLHADAAGRAVLQLSAARVLPPGRAPVLRDLELRCPDARITPEGVGCPAARLRLTGPALRPHAFAAAFRYRAATRLLQLTIPALPLDAGPVRVQGQWSPAGWAIHATAPALDAKAALASARRLGWKLPGVEARGRLGLRLAAAGAGKAVRSVRLRLTARHLTFQEPTGHYAAERFSGGLDLSARHRAARWAGRLRTRLRRGQIYIEPLYLALDRRRAVRTDLTFRWQPLSRRLDLTGIELAQPGVLRARGALGLTLGSPPRVRYVTLASARLELARAYPVYLQPFLYGGTLGALTLSGRVQGRLRYRAGALRSLQATLQGVGIRDRDGRFGLQEASGTLGWTSGSEALDSSLAWRGASLYRIPIGAARVSLRSREAGLRLVGHARIPILDGALRIDDLRVDHPATARMSWQFSGLLTPISLRGLTRRLGWTPLAGRFSGMIPRVRYRDHRVLLDGVLLMRVFGGDVTVRNLVLRHPFGLVPVLEADVRVRNLHLAALTRTFPFGNMEGRLDGAIDGLRLENWRPVRFDARFATPPGDRSRHRISQQAVQSLTRIGGGGIGGLLSGTFLRLFHEFSYRRIGVSCVLRDGVCDMRGIAPAPGGGYYLVEGGGLPRISVVGFVRRVDWATLIDQVRAVIARRAGS